MMSSTTNNMSANYTGVVRFGGSTGTTTSNSTGTGTADNDNDGEKRDNTTCMILVKYFLDRPGYDITNSSSRLWEDAPSIIYANDIYDFLCTQQIVSSPNEEKLLIELYIPHPYNTYMLLDLCKEHNIYFDFTTTTATTSSSSVTAIPASGPGMIHIRLTDLHEILMKQKEQQEQQEEQQQLQVQQQQDQQQQQQMQSPIPQRCNTSPVGLFAFAMTVGLDALNILQSDLLPANNNDSIAPNFLLIYSTYAFFISGLLQFIVGLNEISRNNIYGATAFLGFGCFWLANGTTLILTTYFPDQISETVLLSYNDNTAIATFVREFYIMLFACALFKQTLAMNKLTSGLLGTLIIYLLAAALGGFHTTFVWIKMILGFVLSFYGLFLFYAELSNEVYHRTIINLYPWYDHSSDEVFGTAGRVNTFVQYHRKSTTETAIDLRTAGHPDLLYNASKSLRPNNITSPPTTNTPSGDITSTDIRPTLQLREQLKSERSTTTSYHLRGVRPGT